MTLRIATWNLERPRADQSGKISALESQMQEVDADIWILTETNEAVRPGNDYACVGTSTIRNPLTHTLGENRVSIWSRLPINSIVETHDPETAACADIKTPFGSLLVYGTIIPYHAAGTTYSYRSQGVDVTNQKAWQLHYESIRHHKKDWKRIRDDYPNHHFCCGGDFNQNRDGRRWYGTKYGRELLGDALTHNSLYCLTEEDFRKSGKLESRANVDHLCLNQELTDRVVGVGAWEAGLLPNGRRLSDHNGVSVELRV